MLFDDDLDCSSVDFVDMLNIARRNDLDVFQPALTKDSYYSHPITLQDDTYFGRTTNFVEIMCPVYTSEAWKRMRTFLDDDNVWGWGYDFVTFGKKGIIDCYPVTHTRAVASGSKGAGEQMYNWQIKHKILRPRMILGGRLK